MLNIDSNTTPVIVTRLVNLCNTYRDCFAFSIYELGWTNLVEINIGNNNVPTCKYVKNFHNC